MTSGRQVGKSQDPMPFRALALHLPGRALEDSGDGAPFPGLGLGWAERQTDLQSSWEMRPPRNRERDTPAGHTEGQASVPGVSSGSLGRGAAGLPGAGRVRAGVRARLLSEQGMAGTRLRGRKGHVRVLTGQERPRGSRVGPRPSSCQGHCRCHGAWERAVLRRPLESILVERAGTALWARGGGAPVLAGVPACIQHCSLYWVRA